MKVICPRCSGVVPAARIALAQLSAWCPGCDHVFDIGAPPLARKTTRPRADLPRGVRVVADEGEDPPVGGASPPGSRLAFERRTLGPDGIGALVFGVGWIMAFGLVFSSMLRTAPPGSGVVVAGMALAVIAPGGFATYIGLVAALNRTTIELAEGRFRISHRPLRWFGAEDLPAEDITQLFASESRVGRRNTGSRRSYRLCAKLRNGTTRVLLVNLDAPDDALYLEQRLEARLGLRDLPILDELPR